MSHIQAGALFPPRSTSVDGRRKMSYNIVSLSADNEMAIAQTATLLFTSFQQHWPQAWPDRQSALQEVTASLLAERISRVAVDLAGEVLGWIGGIPQYNGNVWELHPLVVPTVGEKELGDRSC